MSHLFKPLLENGDLGLLKMKDSEEFAFLGKYLLLETKSTYSTVHHDTPDGGSMNAAQ